MKEKRHEVMKMKTYTVFSIAGLIIVTLLIGGTASANSGGFGSFSGAMMGGFRPFLIWRIVMWIVVLGVIGVIVWLIVRTQKQHGGRGSLQEESPLDIVKGRYARGEITREEFENLKRDLQ